MIAVPLNIPYWYDIVGDLSLSEGAGRVDELSVIAALRAPQSVGPYWDVVLAPWPLQTPWPIKNFGVPAKTFRIAQRRGTELAEYFSIVKGGLQQPLHVFRGVKRNMKVGNDMQADRGVYAYVWRPLIAIEWVGTRHGRGGPRVCDPPEARAFVALVRPFSEADGHQVFGVVLRWHWVDADPNTWIPRDADERYEKVEKTP